MNIESKYSRSWRRGSRKYGIVSKWTKIDGKKCATHASEFKIQKCDNGEREETEAVARKVQREGEKEREKKRFTLMILHYLVLLNI